jgi:hypothetical protein
MIPIDSIVVPDPIIRLCAGHYSGQGCMLYAVSSVAGCRIGGRRPRGCDSKEKWYLSIWRDFASDLGFAAGRHRRGDGEGVDELERAEEWADEVCADLAKSYDLEDWDG